MKKNIMAAAMAVILGLTMEVTVMAASPCTGYIDANEDGICDNGDIHCIEYVDANEDGICDNGDTHCIGYVDADKDGICDNCSNTANHCGVRTVRKAKNRCHTAKHHGKHHYSS